jgi:hypothetical protein
LVFAEYRGVTLSKPRAHLFNCFKLYPYLISVIKFNTLYIDVLTEEPRGQFDRKQRLKKDQKHIHKYLTTGTIKIIKYFIYIRACSTVSEPIIKKA